MSEHDNPADHMPPIVPTRDDAVSRRPARKTSRAKKPKANGGGSGPGGVGGLVARLLIVIGLVAATAACVWAWRLQQELDTAESLLEKYEARIGDLEDRLSDTDEGMNQSAAAMSVKIKELYTEVDKLWASAWRRNKERLDELEAGRGEQGQKLAELGTALAAADAARQQNAARLQKLSDDLKRLGRVGVDLDELIARVKQNQDLLERLGEDAGRASLELAKLSKRTQELEDWQGSIDGFRRQVNQNLLQIREQISRLERRARGVNTPASITPSPPVAEPADEPGGGSP